MMEKYGEEEGRRRIKESGRRQNEESEGGREGKVVEGGKYCAC